MEIFERFSSINVLIVGDVMLDRYWWGNVNRISPEAPVPVVNLTGTTMVAGGAANVAANVSGLGAKPLLVGIIGDDADGSIFPEILSASNVSGDYLYKIKTRLTTVKTRIVGHNQQIVRIDTETKIALEKKHEDEIWKTISKLLKQTQIIILSDYGKGFLTDNLTKRLITIASKKGIPILADPKGKNFSKYKGATLLTPNRLEISEAYKLDDYGQGTLNTIGSEIIEELLLNALLVTQGEEGMTLFQKNSEPEHLSALARDVYDVTGAGDTVIACLAVALAGGLTILEAAKIANIAAGIIVEQIGTTAISRESLETALKNN